MIANLPGRPFAGFSHLISFSLPHVSFTLQISMVYYYHDYITNDMDSMIDTITGHWSNE